MTGVLVQVDRRPHECCNKPANLRRTVLDAQRYVEQCLVCGCKHYTLEADPVLLGVAAAPAA